MAWDPGAYLEFGDERLRPALELLRRVPVASPGLVVDLGCGAGNVTAHLRRRWPAARLVGVDASSEMLAAAHRSHPGVAEWVQADLAAWSPPPSPDVLFSNAALHWLDDHDRLFPRLLDSLAPGGALAVQMPRNHGAPSHTRLRETVESGPWRDRLAPLLRPAPVAGPAVYYDLLAPGAASVELWETRYLHVLSGPDPVVAWTRGSVLRPLLAALDSDRERDAFLSDYAARVRRDYPPRPDGTTLFPFRRLFAVAVRA